MPRLKRTDWPEEFVKLTFSSGMVSEDKDCSVKAIALVTGCSYMEAWKIAEEFGRHSKAGMPACQIGFALQSRGFKIEKWKRQKHFDILKSYPAGHNGMKHITTHHPRRFPESWAPYKDKKLLFFCRGYTHVCAFVDGIVCDHAVNNKYHVNDIWEIKKLGE